jgi:para-nitrobenzyl esterase
MPETQTMVTTSLGRIKGALDRGVLSWKGIPYAVPLVKEQQFLPPEPVPAWKGILDASSYSGICPQRSFLRKKVSTDSLTLNIWSRAVDRKRRPVLFFIHGGSLNHGAGSESYYHGSYLASKHDIVVVTCNYRLGVYGFLDFGVLDSSYGPNNGVQDVVLALHWVRDHILNFGGDPDCITIIGQSAGGTIVSALATSSACRGLFHRAVMMSGGPTQVQSPSLCEQSTEAFLDMAKIKSAKELLAYNFDEMITLQKRFIRSYGMGAATFRVTVDGTTITDYPIRGASEGKVFVPMLIGTTKEEMGFMAIRPLARFLDVGAIVTRGLALESSQLQVELEETYKTLFGEDRGMSMMYTDLLFRISSTWFAQAIGTTGNAWMYRFDFETRALRMNGMHAIHSSDLPYVFGNFKPVLVRPMFLLMGDMQPVYKIADEIQRDIVTFMVEGALDWPKADSRSVLGKCYNDRRCIEPLVHGELENLYEKSVYRKRSHAGIPI